MFYTLLSELSQNPFPSFQAYQHDKNVIQVLDASCDPLMVPFAISNCYASLLRISSQHEDLRLLLDTDGKLD